MPSKYQQSYRRMLVDRHIPDWDPAFLSRYDPAALAEQFTRANLTGAMLYCKSHAGLCYWPTRVGKHSGIGARDRRRRYARRVARTKHRRMRLLQRSVRQLCGRDASGMVKFQTARERWAFEFTHDLMATAKSIRPELRLTHNLAPALANWMLAQPLSASVKDTLVAGDLYGDRVEQLVVSKMLLHLSETRPAEFMTSVCVDLSDYVKIKTEEQMRAQAMAATTTSSAFLFIDAIDPVGTVNPAKYERVGYVFAETARYEQFLGGDPIEDSLRREFRS